MMSTIFKLLILTISFSSILKSKNKINRNLNNSYHLSYLINYVTDKNERIFYYFHLLRFNPSNKDSIINTLYELTSNVLNANNSYVRLGGQNFSQVYISNFAILYVHRTYPRQRLLTKKDDKKDKNENSDDQIEITQWDNKNDNWNGSN